MWRSLILFLVLAAGLLWVQYHDAWFGPRRFIVCAGDGTPVPHAIVILRRGEATEADFSTRALGDGRVRIPRDRIHDDTEMFATAPAYGVARGEIPEDDRIVVPEGIAVTLRIAGELDLPQPPRGLQLVLEPEGVARADEALALTEAVAPQAFRPGEEWKPQFLFVDARTRSVPVLLPQRGRWTVRWNVGTRGPADRTGTIWSGSGPPARIPIEILEPGQTVSLEIREAELAKYAAGR